MEQVYNGKELFITGATGFLAKAVVEKLLRSAPYVGKIYVLIRPRKGVEPAARLKKEIIDSQIFDRLRSERPHDFLEFVTSKLHAVAGDVTLPGLGLSTADTQLIQERAQVIIHSAATVQFNEPLEVAVAMNCHGALHALRFAQSCHRVLCYVHVSTAYVNCNQRNVTLQEQLYPLDFDPEAAVAAVSSSSPAELERLTANLMGTYPNTYALTKSMAEHLVTKHAGDLPLVLYRPTIIGAAWKEPVPGWIDQIAGVGAIFLAASMGVLTILPGNPRNVADIVPVDLAVNNLLLSTCVKMLTAASSPNPNREPLIVHCGTSDPRQNPLRWRVPWGVAYNYFSENPPERVLFSPSFSMIQSQKLFEAHWYLRYALPSTLYSAVADRLGDARHSKQASLLAMLTWRVRSLVELFTPFTQNQWIFATDSMTALAALETPEWWVHSGEIVWERYIFNFCVGLKRFVLREQIIGVDHSDVEHTELALSTGRILEWDPDHHAISFPGLLSDVSWAYTSSRKPGYTRAGLLGRVMGLTGWREGMNHEASHVPRRHIGSVSEMRNSVLESDIVRDAIRARAAESGDSVDDLEAQALTMLNKMAARIDYKSVRKFGWLLRKVLRNMYDQIHVDERGLIRIREILTARTGSVVLVPTHRSYIDFLLLSYLCFAYNMPVPHIAAGEDFLGMGLVTSLLRNSGAYFIRRSFADDALYNAVFRAYTQYLVAHGHTLEFFLEGSRSRSGKQLHPKFGILGTVTDCYLSGRVDNIHFVPVTIDYEKPLEVLLHQNELLGEDKVKESVTALLKSANVVRKKFGSVAVRFGQPIDLRAFVAQREVVAPASGSAEAATLVRDLAYELTDAMVANATCTTSHTLAAVLLLYRHGISRKDLVRQSDWLRDEISKRGGRVLGTQGRRPADCVTRALDLMPELVLTRRKDFVEPAIASREQYKNMIGLGYYRNKLLHWFSHEGVLACAYHALDAFSARAPVELDVLTARTSSSSGDDRGVDLGEMMDGALFLHDMLRVECVRKDGTQDRTQLAHALQQLLDRQVLTMRGTNTVAGGANQQPLFALLCSLIWPFIDSYWVAISSLFALRAGVAISPDDLLKRIQWLAETMYHEKLLGFYESCSLETLQNAIATLEHWRVIERSAEPHPRRPHKSGPMMIRLLPQYEQENELELLALRVARFRKLPHGTVALPDSVQRFGRESQLIAQLPTLSKM